MEESLLVKVTLVSVIKSSYTFKQENESDVFI